MQFAAAIAAAAERDPVVAGPAVAGRTLLVDGDALAYACAGRDDTLPGTARRTLIDKIEDAKRKGACEDVIILLTAQSSHKGYRFAVATVKPYQGQRKGGRRPKNWAYLRQLLEAGLPGYRTEITADREADDLFGMFSSAIGWEDVVLHYDDKDMRMVPGTHLDWHSMRTTVVRPDTWELKWDDVVYGRRWFWLQMLHGDGADYVPGLPGYRIDKASGKPKFSQAIKPALCGPAAAEKLLPPTITDEAAAFDRVAALYWSNYGDDWAVHMTEQAVLLWMRRDIKGSPLDCFDPNYGPMRHMPADARLRAEEAVAKRIAACIV